MQNLNVFEEIQSILPAKSDGEYNSVSHPDVLVILAVSVFTATLLKGVVKLLEVSKK